MNLANPHPLTDDDLSKEQQVWNEWNASGGPKYPRDEVVRFCLRRFRDRASRKDVRALDLGCGGGVHSLFLAEEGFDVTVTDISASGVDLTIQRLSERGFQAKSAVASLDDLPFPPQSFDLILSISVIECCMPGVPEAAMPRIGKLLRPGGGGLFVFATDKDYRIADPNNPFVRRGFSKQEVEKMFRGAFPFVQIDRHTATEKGGAIALDNWMVTVGTN